MDYTTYNRFMQELGSQSTTLAPSTDKPIIDALITAASRMVDREATGVADPDAIDYFKAETVTNQELFGRVDRNGMILCYPRKPYITAVTAMSYRAGIRDPWTAIDLTEVMIQGPRVEAYPTGMTFTNARALIKMTYTGGLGATTDALPPDLIEATTMLAIRFYREAETGLTDAIGVAELGTMVYTQALPVRFKAMIQPFKRTVGWRNIA